MHRMYPHVYLRLGEDIHWPVRCVGGLGRYEGKSSTSAWLAHQESIVGLFLMISNNIYGYLFIYQYRQLP